MEGEHMRCGRVKDARTCVCCCGASLPRAHTCGRGRSGIELPRPCWLFARKFSERAGQRLLEEHAALLGI